VERHISKEINNLKHDLNNSIEEVARLKKEIEYLKKNFKDKLTSAYYMQQAMLSPVEIIETSFPGNFIFFKPQDFISGDFYWMRKIEGENKVVIVVADSMGHSIPGAFISILAIAALNSMVMKRNIYSPDLILAELREYIIWEFQQKIRGKDCVSIDMSVVLYDITKNKIQFAGAERPLYHLTDDGLNIYDGNKISVGFHTVMDEFSKTIFRYSPDEFKDSFTDKTKSFSYKLHEFKVKKGDQIYLFSDGYVSQFGGVEKTMVFGSRDFKKLITSLHGIPMSEQKEILTETLATWQGLNDQTDDILVMGLKF
jgi:sigma-B regulation protein RsbU (phosphoserine phosphatase)